MASLAGSVAQSVEHWTFNPLVVSSILTRPTNLSLLRHESVTPLQTGSVFIFQD
jgi:hypothetical protein